MNGPPAFQLYAKDWRSSPIVRQMSRAEKGDCIEMLVASWDQDEPGTLPLEPGKISQITGIETRLVRRFLDKFPAMFAEYTVDSSANGCGTAVGSPSNSRRMVVKVEPIPPAFNPQLAGKRVNWKLRSQWEEMLQRQQKLSDAGKRGNEHRWGKSSGGESGGESGGDRSASASASASAISQIQSQNLLRPPPAAEANVRAKRSARAKRPVSPEGMEIALLLQQRILENNPNAKVPDDDNDKHERICAWGREADLMVRLDHRTPQEITAVLEWSQKNDFWKTNILSMRKLRAQFDTLYLQRKGATNGNRRPSGATRSDRGSYNRKPDHVVL